MCGIAGIINLDTRAVSVAVLKKMTDAIAHRGPNGECHWVNANSNVGLGHRRLSVIDLSPAAAQPMHYHNRYSIVYNGEIYNYLELKQGLIKSGYSFHTASDTEVILACYDKYKEACLPMLDGMFALAIYDAATEEFFFARDRFGEKPLYYSYEPGKYFVFASEMKSLWAAGIPKDVNDRMVYNYLAFGKLHNPGNISETFYNSCRLLPHASYMTLSVFDCRIKKEVRYYEPSMHTNNEISTADAMEKFSSLLHDSVKKRLRSDVSIGSSLSGGLDSSLIVMLIHQLGGSKIPVQKTFSACFPGYKKDERKYIDLVASFINTQPHYVFPSKGGFLENIDLISYHQEEPFTSASVYAQFRVMQEAKNEHVTVLLDGQGADEYLAGYTSFLTPYFNELRKTDKPVYRQEYKAYQQLHAGNSINGLLDKDLKYYIRSFAPGLILPLKKVLAAQRQWKEAFFSKEFYAVNKENVYGDIAYFSNLNLASQRSLFRGDLQNLLRYADRNSMAHGREIRLPFLSHELVDFTLSLPAVYKIHLGWTKWILRETFKNLLPPEIAWRKDKIGYETPQEEWLADAAVSERVRFSKEKLYQAGIISRRWLESTNVASGAIHDKDRSWGTLMAAQLYQ